MKAPVAMVLGLVVVLGWTAHPLCAQEKRAKKMQHSGVAAGVQQGGAQQLGAGGRAGQEAGQLAQLMLANFDQNGDAALNLVELQAALGALMQRMRVNQQAGQGDMAAVMNGQGNMNQFRYGMGNGQAGAAGQEHGAKAQGNRGGGGGKGGRGR